MARIYVYIDRKCHVSLRLSVHVLINHWCDEEKKWEKVYWTASAAAAANEFKLTIELPDSLLTKLSHNYTAHYIDL